MGYNSIDNKILQALGNIPAACAGDENVEEGYNSEDEYSHVGVQLTEEEWQEKDRRFERLIKKKKGNLTVVNYARVLLVLLKGKVKFH